jgi:hypothetical protein
LNERYYDYYFVQDREDPNKIVYLLPYLFNMGETWCDEVRDRYGEHGATGWSDKMRISTYAYWRIKSENVLAI